jgi:succinate-acetate transporter protein
MSKLLIIVLQMVIWITLACLLPTKEYLLVVGGYIFGLLIGCFTTLSSIWKILNEDYKITVGETSIIIEEKESK